MGCIKKNSPFKFRWVGGIFNFRKLGSEKSCDWYNYRYILNDILLLFINNSNGSKQKLSHIHNSRKMGRGDSYVVLPSILLVSK